MSFRDLGLSSETLRAVEEAGYQEPTPIQRQAIPVVLTGQDVLGIAQTGTGKTAAFTLPMIDILSRGQTKARMARSLILEPTRELAAQVAESFEEYGKYHKLSMALLIGGVSFSEQERKLDRGVDVLIATPGRLIDHFQRGKVVLTGIRVLVIDEADRMLDMGFIPDVERICQLITGQHQTLFFSATMPGEIKRLVDRFLTMPKTIEVSPPTSAAVTVAQWVSYVGARDKRKALRQLIQEEDVSNALIFLNRKRDVDSLYKSLEKNDLAVAALHGDMDQSRRMEVLAAFKAGEVDLLVASDVAARGLDLPRVSHVFNYDVPTNPEDYIHRIGRTGRAGRTGRSFMLATPEERKEVGAIFKMLGRDIPIYEIASLSAEPKAKEEHPEESKADQKPRQTSRRSRRSKGRGGDEPAPEKTSDKDQQTSPDAGADKDKDKNREKDKDRTKAKPLAKKPAGKQSSQSRKKRDRGDDSSREQDRVVGMGDHTPDFLLRPVPKPNQADKEKKSSSDTG